MEFCFGAEQRRRVAFRGQVAFVSSDPGVTDSSPLATFLPNCPAPGLGLALKMLLV